MIQKIRTAILLLTCLIFLLLPIQAQAAGWDALVPAESLEDILAGIRVEVLPATYFYLPDGIYARGVYYPGEAIVLAGHTPNLDSVFLHELGHHIAFLNGLPLAGEEGELVADSIAAELKRQGWNFYGGQVVFYRVGGEKSPFLLYSEK